MRKQDSKLGPAAKTLKQFIDQKLPLQDAVVKNVLKLIKACSTEELALLGLQPPPLPAPVPFGSCNSQAPLASQLQAVQDVISTLQYNHMPGYYFNVSKARPLPAILATAAAILREPLPIKCIEAVFIGMLLTQGWCQAQLQRMPVGFKSIGANTQVYRHIVLAVRDPASGLVGGLGISRRNNLMYKPLVFHTLADLVADYRAAYSGWGHQLGKVRVGLPVEHDKSYNGPVCWRYCTVNPEKRSWESVANILNQHAANADKLHAKFCAAAFSSTSSRHSRSTASSPALITPQPHIPRPHQHSSGFAAHHAAVCAPAATVCVGTATPPLSPLTPRSRPHRLVCSVLRSSCPAAVTTWVEPGKQVGTAADGRHSHNIACTISSNTDVVSLGNHGSLVATASCLSNAGIQQHNQQLKQPQQQQHSRFSAACDSSSEEEVDFDSDSEVNAIVDSMRQSPRRQRA